MKITEKTIQQIHKYFSNKRVIPTCAIRSKCEYDSKCNEKDGRQNYNFAFKIIETCHLLPTVEFDYAVKLYHYVERPKSLLLTGTTHIAAAVFPLNDNGPYSFTKHLDISSKIISISIFLEYSDGILQGRFRRYNKMLFTRVE